MFALHKVAVVQHMLPNVIANHIIRYYNEINLWHRRLNNIKQRKLHQLQCKSIGIKTFREKKIILCTPCIQGKQHKIFFSNLTKFIEL